MPQAALEWLWWHLKRTLGINLPAPEKKRVVAILRPFRHIAGGGDDMKNLPDILIAKTFANRDPDHILLEFIRGFLIEHECADRASVARMTDAELLDQGVEMCARRADLIRFSQEVA